VRDAASGEPLRVRFPRAGMDIYLTATRCFA
jgi:hypothetical protein